MSDNRDIITFDKSGLNTDADIIALPKGDSRYRLNVVSSDDGNHYVLTPVKGNTLKTYSFTGGGVYSIVGTVEDKENSALIYFVYDSSVNDYHSIIRYNYSLGTFDDVLKDNTTLFDSSFSGVVDPRIIGNEDDQYLVWADGSYPKMINIAYAIADNYSDPTLENEISFFKKPFIGNIDVTVDKIGTVDNSIKNKIFQFCLRLKYTDNSFSTTSPRSEIPVYDDNISNGRISGEETFNVISLDILLGTFANLSDNVVDSFQVLYKIVDIGLGAPGVWNIYSEVDFVGNGIYQVDFYNDKSIGDVSDSEASRPYDFVPLQSNHVGLIDSNRAVLDVKLDGFDNVDFPSGEEPFVEVDEVAIDASNEELLFQQTSLVGVGSGVFTHSELASIDSDWILSITQDPTPTLDVGRTFSSFELDQGGVFNAMADYINNVVGSPLSAVVSTVVDTDDTITIDASSNSYGVSLLVISKSATVRTLKTKAKYKYGIRYGYGGRIGFVQTHDDLNFETDNNNTISSTDTNYILEATVNLQHQAPIDATDYQIVSFGNDVRASEEYYLQYNEDDLNDDASEYTIYIDDTNTVIKKNDMINRMSDAYNDSIDYGFTFEVGDEVRFIAAWENPVLETALDSSPYTFDAEYSYEITAVNDTEIRLSSAALIAINDNYPSDATEKGYLLIEIISRREIDFTAQEFSPVYQITDRNHLGAAGDTDQIYPGTDAELNITDYFSDAWKTKQVYVNNLNRIDYGLVGFFFFTSWMEKNIISLYYDSNPLIQGRINVVNEFSEQKSYNKIRWGGKYLDESTVNFLTRFEAEDEMALDDRNGIINRIEQIGDTLKVYQERKITSFYLKTTSATDANGGSTYVFSDQVMSVGRQSVYDYGCTNFESYVKNVRNAYFFDVINAYVIRESPSGLEPVSDYGMHTFFKEKSAQILALGRDNVKVLGMYDDDNELYVISFIYATMSNAVVDSVAFHEPTNKWMTHFTLPATALDYYGRISGQTYISFLNGQLYTHNSNTTRCNFWGQQYGSEVRVHSNANPNLIKVWDSLQIVSTGQWAPSTDGDVAVTIPTAQQSRLKAGKFELQEGEYRTEFLRDMLSGESSVQENNLFNGDALRGYEISVNLRNSDTDESNLRMVKINGTTST